MSEIPLDASIDSGAAPAARPTDALRSSLVYGLAGAGLWLVSRYVSPAAPLPGVAASWLWMMLPGYILAGWLARRLSWLERLPLAFVLGKGVITPFIVLGIVGQWRLTTLFACSVGVLVACLALNAWLGWRGTRPADAVTSDTSASPHLVWALALGTALIVGTLAYDAVRWPVHGDDLSTLPFFQDVLADGYISNQEPFHGSGNRVLTRQELIVTVYQQTMLTWQTGLEPATFYLQTRAVYIVLAFLGLYALLHQMLKQRTLAAFIVLLWGIYILATLLVEQTGSHLVTRIAQDKFEGWFVVVPPSLIFLAWYLESQAGRYLVGFSIAAVGATFVHAITLPHLMILGGAMWLLHLVLAARTRRERVALAAAALVFAACLSVPMIEYIRFEEEKKILDALGLLKVDKFGRYHLAIFWERLLLLNGNRFIVGPATILQPINYAGYAVLPIIMTQIRRNNLARLIVGTMLLLPCFLYIPFLAGIVGLLVPASLMWRLAWPFPLLSVISLGWAFWLAWGWLWRRREATAGRQALGVALGLALALIVGAGSLRGSLSGYAERVAVERYSACSRAETVRAYLRQLSEDRSITVLTSPALNECLPSYAARVNVVEYRSIATMARLYQVESGSQSIQRVHDVTYLGTATLLDDVLQEALARYAVDYVVLDRDEMSLDLQFRYQPDVARLVYQDESYDVLAISQPAPLTPLIVGNTALREQRWEDALQLFTPLTGQAATATLAHIGLALASEGLGDLDKALVEWQAAARLAPQEAAIWDQLGVTYLLRQAAAEAITPLQQAVALAPERAPLHTDLGVAYRLADQPDAAWDSFERGLARQAPAGSARYYDLLGDSLANLGWPAGAERSYQLAYGVEPTALRLAQVGAMQRQQGKLAEAEATEKRAVQRDPWFSLPHSNLAAIYRQMGRLDEALQAYEGSLWLDPTDRATFRDAVQLVKRQSGIPEALSYALSWLSLNTILPGPHDAAADLYAEARQFQTAIDEWQFGRELVPVSSIYPEAIGNSYRQLNQFDQARAAYTAALVIDPQSQVARDGLNRLDGRNQERAYEAGPWLKALRRNPTAAQPFINLADVYGRDGDWEKARATLLWANHLEPSNAAVYLSLGDLYRGRGLWAEAQTAYEQTAALRPADGEAYRRLSEVQRAQGDVAAGAAALAQAVTLEPKAAETLVAQGNQALRAGQLGEARRYYSEAIQLQPQNILAYLLLVDLLRNQNEMQAALDTLGDALVHGITDPAIYSTLAGLHLGLGRADAALDWYQAGVDANPLSAAAYVNLAQEYRRRADWDAAVENYQTALQLEPQAVGAWLGLASLHEMRGEPQEALAAYQAAVAAAPAMGLPNLSLGNFYQRRGNLEAAEQAYLAAQAADPTYVDAYLALGSLYGVMEERESAEAQYQQATRVYPGSVAVWAALGDFYNTQGRVDEAIAAYERGAALDPTSVGLWTSLADAYQQSGQFIAAFDAQKRPVDLEPGNAGAWLALAQMHLSRSQTAEAEAALNEALRANQLLVEAQTTLADLWVRQGKIAPAVTLYNNIARQNPGRPDGYLRLAALALTQRNYAEAVNAYQAALAVQPGDGRAYLGLADVYSQQGDVAQAEQVLLGGLSVLPGSAEIYQKLGDLYLLQGREKAAEAVYRETFHLSGNRVSNHIALGSLWQQQGQVEAARQAYSDAIAAQPDNPRGYLALAGLYLAEGDWEHVDTVYQQALAVLPGSDALTSGFSQALAAQGELNAALESARQAVEINPSPGNLLALGQALENVGQYTEAQTWYERAIAADRSWPDGYVALGRLHARLGELEAADTAYRQGIAITNADANPYWRLGELQESLGRSADAEEDYRLSMAADQRNVDAVLRLAAFLNRQGRADEALAWYQTAIRQAPTRVDARLTLANWYAGQGDFDAAEQELQATVAAFPNSGLAIDALADFTTAHGGWDEAETLYRRLISLPGSVLDGYISLGNLYNARGRLTEAEAAYQSAIATQPGNARGYLALATFYSNLSRWDEGAAIYEEALRRLPTVEALSVGLTNLHQRQGAYAEAIAAANAGLALNPASLNLTTALGEVYQARGDADLALALYATRLEQLPGAVSLYLAQGDIWQSELNWTAAQAAYARALQLAPTNAQALLGLGQTARALGAVTEADAYLAQAVQAGIDDPIVLTAIGKVYQSDHQYATAAEVFRLALTSNATYIGAQVGLGQVLEAQGLQDEAQRAYEEAVAVNPGSPQALTALGNFQALTLNQPKSAIPLFQQALAVDPNYLGAYIGLGKAYDASGDFEAGLAAYQAGVATNPQEALAYSALGNAYIARNDLEAAVQVHEQAVVVDPQSAQAQLALGSTLEQAGRIAEAIAAYQKAAELDPGSASAHLALGNVYTLQAQAPKAIAEYEAAIAADPTFGPAYERYGQFYYNLGDYARAISLLEQAVKLDSNSTAAPFLLALSQEELGNWDAAEVYFHITLERNPAYAPALQGLGRVATAEGAYTQAVEYYSAAGRIDHSSANYLAIGTIYRNNLQQPEAAAQAYAQGIALDPLCEFCYLYLGNLQADQGDLALAVTTYGDGIAAGASTGYLENATGNVSYRLGRNSEARDAYEAAVRLNYRIVGAYNGIITVYTVGFYGQNDLVAHYETGGPYALWQETLLGYIFSNRNYLETGKALAHFKRVEAADPEFSAIYRPMALLYESEGDGRTALTYWQKFEQGASGAQLAEAQEHIARLQNNRITSPTDGAHVSGLVEVRGSVLATNFQFYKVEFGYGADPANWYAIGNGVYVAAVRDNVLAYWDVTNLPAGLYTLRLTVVYRDGNTAPAYSLMVSVNQ